jgi:hypothetical protein
MREACNLRLLVSPARIGSIGSSAISIARLQYLTLHAKLEDALRQMGISSSLSDDNRTSRCRTEQHVSM